MSEPLIPITTIYYKTYLKQAIVEALQAVFAQHPDNLLRKTKVGIDFSLEEASFPAVIVRFYERDIHNAGVGHIEWFEIEDNPGQFHAFKHYLYSGDIEFAVYALSSYDRDLIADTLVEVLAMGDLSSWTNDLMDRIYHTSAQVDPKTVDHAINLNTDQIQGFGETQMLAPWGPEDTLLYQTAYRIAIRGEIYSRVPNVQYSRVTEIEMFPYMPVAGEEEPNPEWRGPDGVHGTSDDQYDPAPWSDGAVPEEAQAAAAQPLYPSLALTPSSSLVPQG
jgi:hypothetical protein